MEMWSCVIQKQYKVLKEERKEKMQLYICTKMPKDNEKISETVNYKEIEEVA